MGHGDLLLHFACSADDAPERLAPALSTTLIMNTDHDDALIWILSARIARASNVVLEMDASEVS
jgi:hypothetical protein